MRRWFRLALAGVSLAVCAASVALWVWAGDDAMFLHANFATGRYDGDRSWRGSYLGVCRRQLVFELERIGYAARPATAPSGRWAAEDAVGVRTAALRGFPFDGPLGFHYSADAASTDHGDASTMQMGIPLWAVIVVSLLPSAVLGIATLRRRKARATMPAAA